MYAGGISCCPLVSHDELMVMGQTDRWTVVQTPGLALRFPLDVVGLIRQIKRKWRLQPHMGPSILI